MLLAATDLTITCWGVSWCVVSIRRMSSQRPEVQLNTQYIPCWQYEEYEHSRAAYISRLPKGSLFFQDGLEALRIHGWVRSVSSSIVVEAALTLLMPSPSGMEFAPCVVLALDRFYLGSLDLGGTFFHAQSSFFPLSWALPLPFLLSFLLSLLFLQFLASWSPSDEVERWVQRVSWRSRPLACSRCLREVRQTLTWPCT